MKRSVSIVIGLILLAGLVWGVRAGRETAVAQPTITQTTTAVVPVILSQMATHAAASEVNSTADTTVAGDGNCTLREAIANANSDSDTTSGDCTTGSGADTITFAAGITGGTITLGGTELAIASDLTINGGDGITISGNDLTRVFNITAGDVTFDNLIITDGNVQTTDCGLTSSRCGGGIMIQNNSVVIVTDSTLSSNSADLGGGLFNSKGTAMVVNSTLIGNSASGNSDSYGGGIYNRTTATVTVTNSTLSDNSADVGGGIFNSGIATVTDSTLSGNSADFGGGIFNSGTATVTNSTLSSNLANGGSGGGIYNYGTATVINSTLSSNLANDGGGGSIYNDGGTATVTDSTLSDNSAEYSGGIYNEDGTTTVTDSTLSGNSSTTWGGGILNVNGTVTVTNSTLFDNSAPQGGGIFNMAASGTCADSASLSIHNSTFSNNSAISTGGAIYNWTGVTEIMNSTLTDNIAAANMGGGVASRNYTETCTRMGSTLIAGNTGADVAANETVQRFSSLGYNLIGTAGDNVDFNLDFNATGDQTGVVDALLGPLDDNGGDTETHALLPGSPAIDAADCSSGPATDQRGIARPQDDTCDIGAFELTQQQVFLPFVIK